MSDLLKKACLGVITFGVSCIAIELVPISRQAAYWNRCLDSTVGWINEAADLKGWGEKAKDSLAVGVCNGAVYESKLNTDKNH